MPDDAKKAAEEQVKAVRDLQAKAEQPTDSVFLVSRSAYGGPWSLEEPNSFEAADEQLLRTVRLASFPRSREKVDLAVGGTTVQVYVHYGLAGQGYVARAELEPHLEAIQAAERAVQDQTET